MYDKQAEEKRKFADYSSVGIMFPASIAVGVAIGYFLDQWLNTAPYLLIVFTLSGIAAGFRNLLRVGKVTPRDKKEDSEVKKQAAGK